MRFELATAARILFGADTKNELPSAVAGLGRRTLVVTGTHPERVAHLVHLIATRTAIVGAVETGAEPTVADAARAADKARALGADVVVAIGGGSAIDLGKAVAALVTNDGTPLDYLEVIGAGRKLDKASLPLVAVPTTAGAGSEVTRNAVLRSEVRHVKVSLRSPLMLPRLALVDPTLALDLPPAVTAATGLDALTQNIEPFVCNTPSPFVDGFCREGITAAARSLQRACTHGDDLAARTDMALASLCGGLALANARLGAVHGFAAPIGGRFAAPHGAVCARLLPLVMRANIEALRSRAPEHAALARYAELARLLTGRADARPEDAARWADELVLDLGIPGLGRYGVTDSDRERLVADAKVASSMQGNPLPLFDPELHAILKAAL